MPIYLVRWNDTGHTALVGADDPDDLAQFLHQTDAGIQHAVYKEFEGRLCVEFGPPMDSLPVEGTPVHPSDVSTVDGRMLPRADDERLVSTLGAPATLDLDEAIVEQAFPLYEEALYALEQLLERHAVKLPLPSKLIPSTPEELDDLHDYLHPSVMTREALTMMKGTFDRDLRSNPPGFLPVPSLEPV